jgi:hypothetical protein
MSSDLPAERTPDPVADALRMRASDADRERVAGLLRDAYVEGRLSQVEHEERLAETYRATTYGELVPVLHDLPVPPGTLSVPVNGGISVVRPPSAGPDASLVIRPDLAGQGDTSLVAIFGGFERKGAWPVPPEMSTLCIFGGGQMDLSQAILTSRETVVTAICLFGGLEITVPEGISVRSEAIGIFGGVDAPSEVMDPNAPTLVIKGAAIFGGISVRRPKGPKQWGIAKA